MSERTTDYKINDVTFRVCYADITKVVADALVSSDDNYLSMGGGVSMALWEAGGEEIRREAQKHVPLEIGDVAVTSAGRLRAKYIFHAVTIDYDNLEYPSNESIYTATQKCMELADSLEVRVLAFPALGTGVGRFPFQMAAEVMTRTIADYLIGETKIELVIVALFGREMVKQSDINLFYERAVGLASVSTESERLGTLLSELDTIVQRTGNATLINGLSELSSKLTSARNILKESSQTVEELEDVEVRSSIEEVSRRAVAVSSETIESLTYDDRQLEARVVRTKLAGLLTQLNIGIAHLNKFEIERAKYGGVGVPARLEYAIEELGTENGELEGRIHEVRTQLTNLLGP